MCAHGVCKECMCVHVVCVLTVYMCVHGVFVCIRFVYLLDMCTVCVSAQKGCMWCVCMHWFCVCVGIGSMCVHGE